MPDQMTRAEFAQKIKAQYPVYASIPDDELASKTLEKFPQYAATIKPDADFHSSNQKDARGNATVDPNTIGTLIRHWWANVNPAQLGQMLPFPKALGGSGMDNPLLPSNLAQSLHAIKREGDRRWESGDKVGATAKYVESVIPFLGPLMANMGNEAESGQYMALIGDALGLTTNAAMPRLAEAGQALLKRGTPAVAANANPVERAAVHFGEERGIPIDAGVATGNRFIKSLQGVSDHSPIGSVIAERAKAERASALTRVSQELADQAHPAAITPEQAGANVVGTIRDWRDMMHAQANDAYDRVRTLEQAPEAAGNVPKPPKFSSDVQARMRATAGGVIGNDEYFELRRMQQEFEQFQYAPGKLVADNPGVSSESHYAQGSSNPGVYHDIKAASGTGMTGQQMAKSIARALDTGAFNRAAKGALEVARARLKGGDPTLRAPELPPDAGMEYQSMAAPVDVRSAKEQLRPLEQQLSRQMPPTQQAANPGLNAIRNILAGPDFAPLSQMDRDLSTIKAMARKHGGLAKLAAGALDSAVRDAADLAGPELSQALQQGRAATTAKYQISDVLKKVAGKDADREPVAIMKRLTAPADANIKLLRRVQELAPQQMGEVSRAYLDQLFAKATAEGGFDRAQGLQAEWQKLGSRTKEILFPQPGQRQALDHFFLLAKRIAESPNPSQSGLVAASAGQLAYAFTHPVTGVPIVLGTGALSALLRSRIGVRLLTQGMSMQLKGQAMAAYAQFQRAAKLAAETTRGYPQALPQAADQGSDR